MHGSINVFKATKLFKRIDGLGVIAVYAKLYCFSLSFPDDQRQI